MIILSCLAFIPICWQLAITVDYALFLAVVGVYPLAWAILSFAVQSSEDDRTCPLQVRTEVAMAKSVEHEAKAVRMLSVV